MFAKTKDISARLEAQLQAAQSGWQQLQEQYPWYPFAPIGRYLQEIPDEKLLEHAAIFVHDPLRVHLLVSEIEDKVELEAAALETVLPVPAPAPSHMMVVTSPEPAEAEPAIQHHQEAVEVTEAPGSTEQEEPKPEPEGEVDSKKEVVLPPFSIPSLTAPAPNESFLFQPYHTVDYFASQGIKVDGGATTTRFDTQLKSFTQWLKTMKRMNYETGKATDPAVDAQATASLQVKEVVTEPMAEVLIKQGKYDQAIAMYAKLTLLHPEKSVFFAAQIQKIKEKQ